MQTTSNACSVYVAHFPRTVPKCTGPGQTSQLNLIEGRGACRRRLSVERGSDRHRYRLIGARQSLGLTVGVVGGIGEEPAGKIILWMRLSRSGGRRGRGDDVERARR